MGLRDDDTDPVNVFSSPEPEYVAVSSLELDADGDCDGGDCETVTVCVHGMLRDREAVPSSDAERVERSLVAERQGAARRCKLLGPRLAQRRSGSSARNRQGNAVCY